MMNFRKKYIKKRNFQASKEPIDVNDDNIEHIQVSSEYPVGKKKSISLIMQIIPMML